VTDVVTLGVSDWLALCVTVIEAVWLCVREGVDEALDDSDCVNDGVDENVWLPVAVPLAVMDWVTDADCD